VRWSLVPSLVLPGAALVALLRYAIDLLVPFSLLLLIPHSVRDTLADWLAGERYEDEPDPVWAVAVVSVSLFGTAAGGLWLLSTSPWAVDAGLRGWIPAPLVDLTHVAEQHGWGQRVLLPGAPRQHPPGIVPGPPQGDPVQAGTNSVRTPDGAPSSRQIPQESAGTASPAEPAPSPAAPAPGTMTTLTTSATRVRAGSDALHLIAAVTSSDRGVSGSVTFWDGSSPLGTAGLDASGRAELSVTALSPGNHLLTARYGGHGDYAASRSLPILIVVSP